MIIKNKHITSVFFRLSIVLVVISGFLIFLFIYSSRKKTEVNYAIEVSENIVVNISHLNNNIDRAILLQKIDDTFVTVLSENLILEHNEIMGRLKDSVGKLRNIKYIKTHYSKSHYYDTLISKLNNHNQIYKLAIYTLKEKGNTSDGYIGDLYVKTTQLINELKALPDTGKLEKKLQEISSSYFHTLEVNDLQTFFQFIQDLPFAFYDFEEFDAIAANETITDIQKLLDKIKSLDIRLLGGNEYDGLLEELETSLSELNNYVNKMAESIKSDSANYLKWWIYIYIGITIIFNFLIILMFSKVSSLFTKSLQNIIKTTSELNKGDIHREIPADNQPEFKQITKNLNSHKSELLNRKNFISELLAEKFDREIELLSDDDEFGGELNKLESKLLGTKNEQEKRAKENEIRRYINEGLAKFAEIMRLNSNNTVALGDSLIKNLVKYLNAIQGTLFLTNEEDDKILNLIATFAYDRKKYLTKTVKFGEGLVGTCAIELKTINLKEVPPNYISIRSGLGDTPPNNILIVPVKHDKNVVGVLEVSSLNPFNDHEIDLTEQIADSLASTIISVRNNTRTAQLLEKSQQQAVEMAEQEEEMRQNMEELKATQEESARREEEMQGILDAIGTTFYVIEYNTDGIIEHINDRLVKFLEQPYDFIIGKKHTDIFSSESKITIEMLRDDIINSKKSEKIIEELNWGSRKFKYTHSISPILSKYNAVIKIINLMIIEETDQTN